MCTALGEMPEEKAWPPNFGGRAIMVEREENLDLFLVISVGRETRSSQWFFERFEDLFAKSAV